MRKNEVNATVTPSSGNVFADLGIAHAGERQTKVRLALAINQIPEQRRIPHTEAARRLGANQPKVSAIASYRLEGFSVERLRHFLNALGRDVEIVIRSKPRSRRLARLFVTAIGRFAGRRGPDPAN